MSKLADTKGVWSWANCLLREMFPTSSPSRAKWFQGVGTSVGVVCQESTVPSSEKNKSIFLWGTTLSHPFLYAKSLANPPLPPPWNLKLKQNFKNRKPDLIQPSSENLESLPRAARAAGLCFLDCHSCLDFFPHWDLGIGANQSLFILSIHFFCIQVIKLISIAPD